LALDTADEGTVVGLLDAGVFVAGASLALMPVALGMDDLRARWMPGPRAADLARPTARIHRLWTSGGPALLRGLFLALSTVFPRESQAICGVCVLPAGFTDLPEPLGLVVPRGGPSVDRVDDTPPSSDGIRLLRSYVRWGARPAGPPVVDGSTGAVRVLLWSDLAAVPPWLRAREAP
jgi:hypothetical protein